MAALADGSYVYLLYSGDALRHERLLLSWVTGSTYVVLSPVAGLFLEQVDASNPDLDRLRFRAPGGGLPFRLRCQPIYAFAPRPDGDLAGVLAEGRRFARAERQARGLVGVGAGGEPVPGAAFAPLVVRSGRRPPQRQGAVCRPREGPSPWGQAEASTTRSFSRCKPLCERDRRG